MPEWPIPDRGQPGGWAELWVMPQAVVWEREKLERVVARYLLMRSEVETADGGAEKPGSAAMFGQVLAMEDRLLLSPYKLQQAHYRVAPDEVGEQRQTRASSRTRLAAVDRSAG